MAEDFAWRNLKFFFGAWGLIVIILILMVFWPNKDKTA